MPLTDKQLTKIARYINAQDEIPYFEDEDYIEKGNEETPLTAGELILYADNTYSLYQQKKDIIKNLSKKIQKGNYDPNLAPKLWAYWVDNAAKMYVKEMGTNLPWNVAFPKAVRMEAAQEIAEREERYITGGEYDDVGSW
jgi:hypothetical protein